MLDRIMQNLVTVTNIPPKQNKPKANGYEHQGEGISNFFMKNKVRLSMEPKTKSQIVLQSAIWETESSQEMFDFESNKNVKIRDFRVEGANDIYIVSPESRKSRCMIVKSGVYNQNLYCGKIDIYRGVWNYIPGGQIDSYRVVDSKRGAMLEAGGTLRIGRMQYFIKEIYNGFSSKVQQNPKSSASLKQKSHLKSLKGGACKFCLCDETDNPDTLISPCNCKGSCAQVHIECLKQWLINKVSRKSTSNVDYLNYDNFNCELCKEELPITLTVDGKVYNMLNESETKQDPYIIIEGLPNEKSSTKNNITVKIKFPVNKTLQVIGRGHDADVRLEDVSISRQHGFIEFQSGKILLRDNKSKFGTLSKLKAGENVEFGKELKIQAGRMVLRVADKVQNENKYP